MSASDLLITCFKPAKQQRSHIHSYWPPVDLDKDTIQEGGRNSRVFGEKICDKFITKFGEEFSESPNSSPNLVKNPVRSPNLVTNSVTYFVRNVVAHLYLHQI